MVRHKYISYTRTTFNWRASVASETLTGVTQSKIGDVYWRASEASETVLGVDNAKSGICYIYIIHLIQENITSLLA